MLVCVAMNAIENIKSNWKRTAPVFCLVSFVCDVASCFDLCLTCQLCVCEHYLACWVINKGCIVFAIYSSVVVVVIVAVVIIAVVCL